MQWELGFELQLFLFFQQSEFCSFKSVPSPLLSLVDLPNDGFNKAGHINLVINTCLLITDDIKSRTEIFSVGWYRHGKKNPYTTKYI